MRTLSDYRIEYKRENNKKAYKICLTLAPIFRVVALVMILPTIFLSLYYLICVCGCLILSFVVDIFAKRSVFTLRYDYANGILHVKKVNIDGESKELNNFDCKKITNLSVVTVETVAQNDLDYRFHTDEKFENMTTKFLYEGKTVYITPDKYLYAILEEEMANDISR